MGIADHIGNGLRAAVDILIPRECAVCGRRLLGNERHLCIYCESDLPLTYFWNMTENQMADRFNELIQRYLVSGMSDDRSAGTGDPACDATPADNETLIDGRSHLPPRLPYLYATALFFYHGDADYRKIPQRVKYSGDRSIGRYYGSILGKFISESPMYKDIDAVIPIPLHWSRRWSRGYNQAEIIAESIAGELGAGLRTDILSRIKRTRTQTVLSVKQKAANVQNAFSISPGFLREEKANYGKTRNHPEHILLVDDVFTTGATMTSCSIALYRHFGHDIRISAATLGFVNQW